MNILIAETTEALAMRLGWDTPGSQGDIVWTRPNAADVYILVDALADRLRGEPLAATHYPPWAQDLTLEQLGVLLEVHWDTDAADAIVVQPVTRGGSHA